MARSRPRLPRPPAHRAAARGPPTTDLLDDLGSRHVAGEPGLSRRTERAVHATPGLARDADRDAVGVAHEHRLDDGTVMEAPRVLHRAPVVGDTPHDRRQQGREQVGDELGAHRLGQVGHLPGIVLEPLEVVGRQLLGAEALVPQRLHGLLALRRREVGEVTRRLAPPRRGEGQLPRLGRGGRRLGQHDRSGSGGRQSWSPHRLRRSQNASPAGAHRDEGGCRPAAARAAAHSDVGARCSATPSPPSTTSAALAVAYATSPRIAMTAPVTPLTRTRRPESEARRWGRAARLTWKAVSRLRASDRCQREESVAPRSPPRVSGRPR